MSGQHTTVLVITITFKVTNSMETITKQIKLFLMMAKNMTENIKSEDNNHT